MIAQHPAPVVPARAVWLDAIEQLEEALRNGDVTAVVAIPLDELRGPAPAELSDRLREARSGIAVLEQQVASQLEVIADELETIRSRQRHAPAAAPAPSQFDRSF